MKLTCIKDSKLGFFKQSKQYEVSVFDGHFAYVIAEDNSLIHLSVNGLKNLFDSEDVLYLVLSQGK